MNWGKSRAIRVGRQALMALGLIAVCSPSAFSEPLRIQGIHAPELFSGYVYPIMGPRLSSDFGLRRHPLKKHRHHHQGIDLAAPRGAPIRAIDGGRVIYADPFGGYGKIVVIKHSSGLTSHYGHCDRIKVSVGDVVRAGDIVATVGSSGISTGPHLHFEIRKDGEARDPERFLPGLADPAKG